MDVSPSHSSQPINPIQSSEIQVDIPSPLGLAALMAIIGSLNAGNETTQIRLEVTKIGTNTQTQLAQLKGTIKFQVQQNTTGMSDQAKTDTINQTNQYNQNVTSLQQSITQQIVIIKQQMQQLGSMTQADMQSSSQKMQEMSAILSMLDKMADQANKMITPR